MSDRKLEDVDVEKGEILDGGNKDEDDAKEMERPPKHIAIILGQSGREQRHREVTPQVHSEHMAAWYLHGIALAVSIGQPALATSLLELMENTMRRAQRTHEEWVRRPSVKPNE